MLHPSHKLEYFKRFRWPTGWQATARELLREEYERAYSGRTASDSEGEDGEPGDQDDDDDAPHAPSARSSLREVASDEDDFDDLPDMSLPPCVLLILTCCVLTSVLPDFTYILNSLTAGSPPCGRIWGATGDKMHAPTGLGGVPLHPARC